MALFPGPFTAPQQFAPVPPLKEALLEIVYDPGFSVRCIVSSIIGAIIYVTMSSVLHKIFYREVRRNIFDWSLRADFSLALVSLAFGSPIISAFAVAHEKWGIMKTYNNIDEASWDGYGGWAWWAASIPLYLLLWDAVFYVLHLALHIEPLYSISHANHHAFRPPVAWSGIAIDPIENIFSGLGPYLIPLFILPCHLPTVYVINIILVGWASLLHSSCPWRGNWLLTSPVAHNLHHESGIVNGNYGALFKIYDRLFGTLVEDRVPFWMVHEDKARADKAAEKRAAGTGSGSGSSSPVAAAPAAGIVKALAAAATAGPAASAGKRRRVTTPTGKVGAQ